FSAVKVKGRPLYDYARKGQEVERRLRTIHIGRLEPKDLGAGEDGLGEIELLVECSGGTYIRTLAHDLGQRLGCGAYLSGLRRTGVGRFGLEHAVTIEEVTPESLLPLEAALSNLPAYTTTPEEAARVQNGMAIALAEPVSVPEGTTARLLLLSPEGRVLGIAAAGGHVAQPECVIPPDARL
ncbi:tRNA pseudouridine(55) synthase TruB, partial [bacterium]